MTLKALIIKPGDINDLSDILRIARVESRKVLGVDKVKVCPILYCYGESYIVVVEAEGCSKASGVGSGKAKTE